MSVVEVYSESSDSHGKHLSVTFQVLDSNVMMVSQASALVVKSEVLDIFTSISNVLHLVCKTIVGESCAAVDPELEGLKGFWESVSEGFEELISDLHAPSEVDAQFLQALLFVESLGEFLENVEAEVSVLVEDEVDVLKVVVLAENLGKGFHGGDVGGHLHVEEDALAGQFVCLEVRVSNLWGVKVDAAHFCHD